MGFSKLSSPQEAEHDETDQSAMYDSVAQIMGYSPKDSVPSQEVDLLDFTSEAVTPTVQTKTTSGGPVEEGKDSPNDLLDNTDLLSSPFTVPVTTEEPIFDLLTLPNNQDTAAVEYPPEEDNLLIDLSYSDKPSVEPIITVTTVDREGSPTGVEDLVQDKSSPAEDPSLVEKLQQGKTKNQEDEYHCLGDFPCSTNDCSIL
jgi:hypothetical protein